MTTQTTQTTQTTAAPQAETSSGRVSGTSVSTRHGLVAEYLGIPFGALGPGRARFEPAEPPAPWSGIRECTQPGPTVPQNPDPFAAQAGLPQRAFDAQNGLNLNIWTPQTDATALPVLVWVHGGANISGSNADPLQNGAELAAEGELVVVSVNYRLGAFGFLWLEDAAGGTGGTGYTGDAADVAGIGNAAIHDLLAALCWVQRDIGAFGGDPANVTIAGQSAGAALVGTLLGVPSIAGLIRRAIMQSGTAERVHKPSDAGALTRELLGYLGIDEADAADVLERSTDDILAAQAALVEAHQRDEVGLSITFRPVIDAALIPAVPVDSVREGLGSEIDLLIGTNLDEASLFLAFGPPESAPGAFAAILEREIGGSGGGVASAASAAAFRAALASDAGENPTDTSVLEAFLSDRSYRQPSNRLLDARAAGVGAGRSYSYLFTWQSPALNGRLGACHGVELPFVFGTFDRSEAGFFAGAGAPRSLSSAVIAAWSAFARTGDPGTSLAWPAYELPTRTTMVWDEHPRLVDDPRAALRLFASTSKVN